MASAERPDLDITASAAADERLAPNDTPPRLGRYVLLDRLGVGGMGTVFLAHDPELDRKVAVKLLHTRNHRTRSQLRLQREAQAMARLSHPNVVAVYDVGSIGDELFAAMEYVPGLNLEDWLAAEPRSIETILARFIEAGRGLAAAHAAGLVHRDFKPANVLISADGPAKVTDFGLVRVSEAALEFDEADGEDGGSGSGSGSGSSSNSALGVRLTRVGAVLGTPAYMAPEQLEGEAADARSDQFAFCVALHEALWGTSPFAGSTMRDRARNVLDDLRQARSSTIQIPPRIADAIDRGLARDRADRFASIDELLAQLVAPEPSRRRQWIAGACAFGLALLVGAGAFAEHRWERAQCEDEAGVAERRWRELEPELAASIAAGAPGYAGDNLTRVKASLDDWVRRWTIERRAACLSDMADGADMADMAETPNPPARACLDDQLAAFDSLVTVFAEHGRDPGVASLAIDAASSLPDPSRCEDQQWLRSAPSCTGARGFELRTRLHRVRALELAGRYDDGLSAGQALLAKGDLSGCPGLEAEAQIATANLQLRAREFDEAEISLRAALRWAGVHDDPRLLYAATVGLHRRALRAGEFESAQLWLDFADIYLERLGSPAELAVEYQLHRATLLTERREFEAAEQQLEHTRALLLEVFGDRHPSYIRLLTAIGRVHVRQGRGRQAVVAYERVRTRVQAIFGPNHPRVVSAKISLGWAYAEAGEAEHALNVARDALTSAELVYGPEHHEALVARSNVTMVLLRLGRLAAARPLFDDLLARVAQLPEPNPDLLGIVSSNHSVLLIKLGEYAQAEAAARRSIEVYERRYGPNHHGAAAAAMHNLASILHHRRRYAEALPIVEYFREQHEAESPESSGFAYTLSHISEIELALGRHHAALQHADRAHAIAAKTLGERHPGFVDHLRSLAEAEAQNDLQERALLHLREAVRVCASLDDPASESCVRSRVELASLLLDGPKPRAAQRLADLGEARTLAVAAYDASSSGILQVPWIRATAAFTLARVVAAEAGDPRRVAGLIREALAHLDEVPEHGHRELALREAIAASALAGAGRRVDPGQATEL